MIICWPGFPGHCLLTCGHRTAAKAAFFAASSACLLRYRACFGTVPASVPRPGKRNTRPPFIQYRCGVYSIPALGLFSAANSEFTRLEFNSVLVNADFGQLISCGADPEDET